LTICETAKSTLIVIAQSQYPQPAPRDPKKKKKNARRQGGCQRRLYKQLRKEEKQKARENTYPTECRIPENSRER